MSSIMTNSAAMTALQTLKTTNKMLDTTQGRISTGYRVAEASDNAAYWSIATTMRSDNKALSTVQDSLGLGAAMVDVAYTAMDSAKDYLDEIKTKLVAATAPGVDKSKIQAEITELQSQLTSLASSASFSGSNWLSTNSDASGYSATQQIVSSFTRNADNTITLGKIDVDLTQFALFDSGASGAGLLEKASGNADTGTIAGSNTSAATTVAGAATSATAGTLDTGDLSFANDADNGDTLDFTLDIGGTSVALNGISLDGITTTAQLAAAVTTAITGTALEGLVTVADNGGTNGLLFTTTDTGADATIAISGWTYNDDGDTNGAATYTPGNVTYTAGTDAGGAATAGSSTMTGTFSAITLDADDAISFNINVDGTDHTITVDAATALTSAHGSATISDTAEMVQVLTKAFENANLTVGGGANDVNISLNADNQIVFSSNTTGVSSKVELSAVRANSGSADFNIAEVNITGATADQMESYINGVNAMIESVTGAASSLGAIKSRIDMQNSFVSNLMDAVDRGVSQLVDADMEEESTKLQALQVQQQLGIQALSIANSNSQMILSLFRG